MKNLLPPALAALLLASCADASNTSLPSKSDKPAASQDENDEGATKSNSTSAPAKQSLPSLPDRTPVAGPRLSSSRQVLTTGAFTAVAPTVRANDYHSSDVTGTNCMSCHGTGGSAPHFALGGTIALGKNWVTGTPAWSTGGSAGNNDDSYGGYHDNYGGYDDGSYGGYGLCDDGSYSEGGYGSYDDGGYGSYDDGGYGSYDDGGYGSYDDGGYGYGSSCGTKGWPADRTSPVSTGLRIVGADGYVFDTYTDGDGNFWFKSKADVAVPAYTGLRYKDFSVTGDTNGIACASCHESGAADSPGRLWVWDGPTPKN